MDPKKLKAYANPVHDDEHEELHEDEAHEAAESEEYEELEHEHDEDPGFEDFMGDLFTHAEDLEEAAADISEELSHDVQPSPETVEQMQDQLAGMPDGIKQGIAEYLVGMPFEDVLALVEDLAAEERVASTDQVAGWLYWIAKNA